MPHARILLPCLLLALGAQEPEPPLADELTTLIERTNALASFHAVWLGTEAGVRLEVAYQAPGKGRLSLENGAESHETRFDEQRLYFQDDEGAWRHAELPHSEARVKLDELFPVERRLGPGFELLAGGTIGISASYQPHGREALFRWLEGMRHEREGEEVLREGDVFVWTRKNSTCRVARDSGFPREISVRFPEVKLELRLAELTLDEEEVPLDLPEESERAPEDDPQRLMVEMWDLPSMVRSSAFGRLGGQLESGSRKWDTRTRGEWDELLVALHGPDVEGRLLGWMKELLDYLVEALRKARTTLEQNDTPETRAEVTRQLDELEQSLAPGFEQAPQDYLAGLEELEDARSELLEAEREVILRLHAERVTQPILEFLTQARASILGE